MCGFEAVVVWSCADECVGGVVYVCVWKVFADEGDICAHSEGFNQQHLGLLSLNPKTSRQEREEAYSARCFSQGVCVCVKLRTSLSTHSTGFQHSAHTPWIHHLSNQSIERWWIMSKTANFFAVVKHEQWAVRRSHRNVTTDSNVCVYMYVCVCVCVCVCELERP